MKRVLFLDFDGVLNNHTFMLKIPEDSENYKDEIDPIALARLHRVIQTTRAQIVISSSWRHHVSIPQFEELLGLPVLDITPDHCTPIEGSTLVLAKERGDEITAWLAANPVDCYAIVDDCSSAGVGHHGRFVKTTWAEGMLDKHADELIKLLS